MSMRISLTLEHVDDITLDDLRAFVRLADASGAYVSSSCAIASDMEHDDQPAELWMYVDGATLSLTPERSRNQGRTQ